MNAKLSLLQAFRHPRVFISILILLLNDHILKHIAPFWLANRGQARQSKSSLATAATAKLAYAVLTLGALTTVASAYPTIFSVEHVIVEGNTLYAPSQRLGGTGYIESTDLGKTWAWIVPPPKAIRQALDTPATLPKTLCDPTNPQTCYRITGQEQVEESQDGGRTWKTAWQIPSERKSYIVRVAYDVAYLYFKHTDFSPYDMVFLPGESPSTLMVLMGDEGFLLHAPGHAWQRKSMMLITANGAEPISISSPTPYQAASLGEALAATLPEWFEAVVVGVVVYALFTYTSTKHRAGLTAQSRCYSHMIDVGLASLVALSTGPSFVVWALGWIINYELAQNTAVKFGLISLAAAFIIRHLLRQQTA